MAKRALGLGPRLNSLPWYCFELTLKTVTLYFQVANEFQRKDLCMWICDDSKDNLSMGDADLNQSKPPGYYVHSNAGLFPAPWPANTDISKTLELFQVFGVYIAKAIQVK